ncbi:MAG: hypothetical protein M1813_001717 [Trichoglossum hirsutum]|nr:MAG: hypothetical protein M1813_001717 [Trichoglossum hirsutum]
MSILLKSTLDQIKEGPEEFCEVQANDRYIDGDLPSIGDLIALADKKLELLYDLRDRTIEELNLENDKYIVTPGHLVLTASSRQLISLLVNHPIILEKLTIDSDAVLEHPRCFSYATTSKAGSESSLLALTKRTGGLSATGDIRRADRDHRIATYIPLASKAFYALQQAERESVLPESIAGLKPIAKPYQTRIRAIAAMKGTSHPDFLGRTTDWPGFQHGNGACAMLLFLPRDDGV